MTRGGGHEKSPKQRGRVNFEQVNSIPIQVTPTRWRIHSYWHTRPTWSLMFRRRRRRSQNRRPRHQVQKLLAMRARYKEIAPVTQVFQYGKSSISCGKIMGTLLVEAWGAVEESFFRSQVSDNDGQVRSRHRG